MINQRYKIVEKLGEGRTQVFLCEDTFLDNREIALKLLSNKGDQKEERAFKDEFLTLRKLSHLHIIKAFEYRTVIELDDEDSKNNVTKGCKFFTMEYLKGKHISDFYDIVDEDLLRNLTYQLADVLFYLHSFNYTFKDLKVENVIVTGDYENPKVTLIDFGAVMSSIEFQEDSGYGTNAYLAPEFFIKGADPNNKLVDIYALGILVYKLIYDYFPFENEENIELFRAHLQHEPEFLITPYSDDLINVVKKLIQKEPENRLKSVVDVIYALGYSDYSKITEWIPPKVYVKNNLMMSLVNDYLYSKKVEKAIIVVGPEGSGKTTLIEEIFYNFRYVIKFNRSDVNGSKDFSIFLLEKILFNPYLNFYFSDRLSEKILNAINFPSSDPNQELKALFIEICQNHKFIIEFDDFNDYDEKVLGFLREIIPIFLVNDIKVIIAENSERNTKTEFIESALKRYAQPFDPEQVREYLEKTFPNEINIEPIMDSIINHSDLMPGSISTVLREMFRNSMFIIYEGEIALHSEIEKIEDFFVKLQNINEQKFAQISTQEKQIINFVSAVNFRVTNHLLERFYNLKPEKLESIFQNLLEKNIIREYFDGYIELASEALNRLVYDSLENKTEFHSRIAQFISENDDFSINLTELADQLEMAEEYEKCYSVLLKVSDLPENEKLYSFTKELLERAIALPEIRQNKILSKIKLAEIYLKLGEYSNALDIITSVENEDNTIEKEENFLILKAESLDGVGEIHAAKDLYEMISNVTASDITYAKVKCEMAGLELVFRNFDLAKEICLEIINSKKYAQLYNAKANNILGIINFELNNLESATDHFMKALNYYQNAKMLNEAIKIETNIGNIYSIAGDREKAKYHWDNSELRNKEVGSLKNEAILGVNYGNYYFDELELDKAIENYKYASVIFNNIGMQYGKELILMNLGETYLLNCEYEKSKSIFDEARDYYSSKGNTNELLEIEYFNNKLNKEFGNYSEDKSENKNTFSSQDFNTEKADSNLRCLMVLAESEESMSQHIDEIHELLNSSELLSIDIYYRLSLLYIDYLIYKSDFKLLHEFLIRESVSDVFQASLFKKAEYYYLLAKSIMQLSSISIDNPYDYLIKSYEIISDKSITELTWKITFSMAETYSDRGNLSKAEEYIILTEQLIHHLSEKISNPTARHHYLNQKNRRSVLKKIAVWNDLLKR